MRLSFLDQISIRAKLWLLAGSLMSIVVILWGVSFGLQAYLGAKTDQMTHAMDQAAHVADKARETQIEFKTQVQEWKDILLRGHNPTLMAKYRNNFEKSEQAVDKNLAELETLMKGLGASTPQVDKTLQEHRALGARYRQALATWSEKDALTYRAVDAQLMGIDRPMNEAIGKLAEETIQNGAAFEDRMKAEINAVVAANRVFNIALLVAGLVLALLITRAIFGRIHGTLAEVTRSLERMVAGDFSQRMTIHSSDELGRMAEDFNNALKRFQALFAQLQDASVKVAQGSMELSATASEVSRATDEIARFAENQRVTSERTSAAMTEFAASIQEVSGHVRNSGARTETMVQAAEEGTRQGEATVTAMQAIREATEQMVKAVQVIQDLARQTNLLALNAAIEAAKAGSHGAGFAVVAEEVRKLTEHSAGAAKQIGDLITQTEEAMQSGIRTVEATEAVILTIQENIHAVAGAARQIGSATEEQGRTSDEVARQVEESALSTERSATAATELAHTVEEVNRTAEYLAHIAEDLSASLSRFKTA